MPSNMKAPRQRFRILEFINPRTGTTSWRVSGIKRNGERIRENYADPQEAQFRYTELEGEFHATNGTAALRATRLTDEQVAIAEAGFKRLERDQDLLTAIATAYRERGEATLAWPMNVQHEASGKAKIKLAQRIQEIAKNV